MAFRRNPEAFTPTTFTSIVESLFDADITATADRPFLMGKPKPFALRSRTGINVFIKDDSGPILSSLTPRFARGVNGDSIQIFYDEQFDSRYDFDQRTGLVTHIRLGYPSFRIWTTRTLIPDNTLMEDFATPIRTVIGATLLLEPSQLRMAAKHGIIAMDRSSREKEEIGIAVPRARLPIFFLHPKELPGWFAEVRGKTPRTLVVIGSEDTRLSRVRRSLRALQLGKPVSVTVV